MEKKISLEEILLSNTSIDRNTINNNDFDDILSSMKIACKQVLELASENADTKVIKRLECEDHTPFMGPCCSCGEYVNREIIVGSVVDKQSIIDTIKQVK